MKIRGIAGLFMLALMCTACGGDAGSGEEEGLPEGGAPGGGQAAAPAGPAASAPLIADMRSRVVTLQAAGGDEIPALVPEHTRMVHDMLTAMRTERTARGQSGPAAWDATVDSVEQDLVRMQTMSQADLEALMETHTGRLTRLMDMHSQPAP
jgi:hypothetical protein